MGSVRSMFGWDWVRVNAAALAVVVAIVGGLTSAIWYLGTLMGTLAPTASVATVDEKVEALNVRVETLATTDDVEALNVRVETLATTDEVEALDEKVEALNVRVETLATTDDVNAVDEKVEALNVRVETLATTDDVNAVSVKVNQLQAMFPLMVSCIIEQNRQILVALAQDQLPVPELPASCETSLALAQAGATGR
jgi:chaperonin cofactor prefoldin